MGSGRLGKRLVSRLVPSADGAPPPVRAPVRLPRSAGTGHVRDNGRPPDARWAPRYHEGAPTTKVDAGVRRTSRSSWVLPSGPRKSSGTKRSCHDGGEAGGT